MSDFAAADRPPPAGGRCQAQAGHTRGAVYWHFANKLEVFEAVMKRVESPFISQLDQIASSNSDQPLQALRPVNVCFRAYSESGNRRRASSSSQRAASANSLRAKARELRYALPGVSAGPPIQVVIPPSQTDCKPALSSLSYSHRSLARRHEITPFQFGMRRDAVSSKETVRRRKER